MTSLVESFCKIQSLKNLYEYQTPLAKNERGILAFDLDQTLIQAKPTLGDEHFYHFLMKSNREEGLDSDAHYYWTSKIRAKITYESCESIEKIKQIISSFKEQGWTVKILTSRGLDMRDITEKHLAESGINLTIDDVIFTEAHPEGNGEFLKKNESLIKWMKAQQPQWESSQALQVIFLDDSEKHCKDVSKVADEVEKATVTCLHYTRALPNPMLSQAQMEQLIVQLHAHKEGQPIPYEHNKSHLQNAMKKLELQQATTKALYNTIKKIAELDNLPFSEDTKPPLVIITDPGEDVDDTFALMLAATSKQYSLKAVISANEDLNNQGIGKIACYARKLLDAMGRSDVPVYQGDSLGKHPFLCDQELYPEDIQKQNLDYLNAVKSLAVLYPKVYILSIAAMTPLANIVQADWFDSKKFVIFQMGGNFSSDTEAEYNIECDIKAAQQVFSSNVDIHLIPSNSTFQEPMKLNEKSKILELVSSMANKKKRVFELLMQNYQRFREVYGKKYGYFPHLSDALAFSALEEKGFLHFSTKKIEVLDTGRTVPSENNSAINVSDSDVDSEKFLDYLHDRLTNLSTIPDSV